MNPILLIVLMILFTCLCITFLIIWNRGNQNCAIMLEPLNDNDYKFKDFYTFGLEILNIIKFNVHSEKLQKKMKECKIIFGEKYAEFYYRINLAQKITGAYALLVIGLFLGILLNEIFIALFGLVSAGVMVYYFDSLISDIMNKREDEITREFPEILSKLALLVNAGMILQEAWEKVGMTGTSTMYQEMTKSIQDMKNGVPESDAYLNFARRCNSKQVNKFASTLIQNMEKGNSELVFFLRSSSDEIWNEKKQYVRRKGEEASNKLVIPISIMFLGLMIMIMLPIFSSMAL